MRIGLTLPLVLQTAAESVELAKEAHARGVREVWLAEVGANDSYALAGALSQAMPATRFGTAVVPAQTRAPMVHAMAAATLSQLTGGRFVLGLGISSENIVRDWAGLAFDRPVRRMREHVEVLRRALDGERVDFDGDTLSVHRFRLQTRPEGRVPIYLAALNPGMLHLAGAVADGVILNMVPEAALAQVLGAVREGAERAGRDPGAIEVVSRIHVHVTDDPETDVNLVRSAFGAYAATQGYNRLFRWIGFEDEATAIAEAFARGDREAVAAAMTQRLCDAMAVVGDTESVRARLRAYADAGVDVVVLNPIWPDPQRQRRTLDALWDCLDAIASTGGGALGVVRGTQPSGTPL